MVVVVVVVVFTFKTVPNSLSSTSICPEIYFLRKAGKEHELSHQCRS